MFVVAGSSIVRLCILGYVGRGDSVVGWGSNGVDYGSNRIGVGGGVDTRECCRVVVVVVVERVVGRGVGKKKVERIIEMLREMLLSCVARSSFYKF